ncbi:MAG: iron-containing alcohol dehydrogenase [Methyloceanibacter sp.]|nr:iron-containing alcohol dehydrogenase [Methyloceanibacter sp.]
MPDFFFLPPMNIAGDGALDAAVDQMVSQGFKKALIVTDEPLHRQTHATRPLIDRLEANGIDYVVYDQVTPNPTVTECNNGATTYAREGCDFLISFGGGSPHDCCKGIGIVATNGGSIRDYAGVDQMREKMAPMFAVNTTSGTASEITRFAIITDEEARSKFPVVDWRCTPSVSVDDPKLMEGMPPGLTAATGMDALSHALEAYVSTAASHLTDPGALRAVELIEKSLVNAYRDGQNRNARSDMTYAEFLAGMAFNNASLGFVHAMSHQVGGTYHTLAHGVINSVLMPHVIAWNAAVAGNRYAEIAAHLGVETQSRSTDEIVEGLIGKVLSFNEDLDMPANLGEMGVKNEDVPHLAEYALADPCAATNPRPATVSEMQALFRRAISGEGIPHHSAAA